MLTRPRTWLLILVLALVSCNLSFCAAQASSEVDKATQQATHGTLPVAATPPAQDEATREAAERYAEATELYTKALSLLSTLRSRSISLIPPPSTSLFSSSSYTPFFDLIESAGGPISPLVKLLRRYTKPSTQDTIDEEGEGWSILGSLYKLSGATSLLGDYVEEDGDREKKVTNALNSNGQLSKSDVRFGLGMVVDMLRQAGEGGKDEAWETLGELSMWGKHGAEQNLTTALHAYERLAERTGHPVAQYNVGFLKSTGLAEGSEMEGDQSEALLYYIFAALGGASQAEMTVGYRHWVGIGTKQSCGDALPFYKSAAEKAIKYFNSGAPGGRNLPPAKNRLSDIEGGVYGPGASVSSSGPHALKLAHSSHAHEHPTTAQEWEDVLEFYSFHAARGDASFMFKLGRIYYQGFGPTASAGRDYEMAMKWFTRITRSVWASDPKPSQMKTMLATGGYNHNKDVRQKATDYQYMVAALASGYIGKMYLRGEGVKQDFAKAYLWFSRGSARGDHVSHNGLGLMYRDGLGLTADSARAFNFFQSASSDNLAEAQVNLGKLYLDNGEYQVASQYFEMAIKNGDTFQAFYYLAELNAFAVARPDLCPVAVSFYKIVAERGDWTHEIWNQAERAWNRGDRQRALLGYWMMAERGYEVAQNNVAFILDRDKSALQLPSFLKVLQPPPGPLINNNVTDRLALIHWTRSAAQDNIDALVKMGDYYLKGIGLPNGQPQPQKAAACYQTASNTHVSALAMHSLGWMHEVGLGVNKDFHLAKRYYDEALETNTEAYLPVVLSLFKLHLRSVYLAIKGGDPASLTLNNPFSASVETPDAPLGALERLYLVFSHLIKLQFSSAFEELFSGQPRNAIVSEEEVEEVQDPLLDAQRALSSDGEGEWVREARERERLERSEDGEDEYDLRDGGDVWESLAIVGCCMLIGYFIYHRQARQEGVRAAAEEERRRQARAAMAGIDPQ